MRTLLRHAPTGLYLQAADMWTGNREEAMDFKSMRQAIWFAERAGYSKMEVTLVSERSKGFTRVPVSTLRPSLSLKFR